MAIQRIVDTSPHDDDAEEQRIEVSLRPQSFSEYVGQERLKRNAAATGGGAAGRRVLALF